MRHGTACPPSTSTYPVAMFVMVRIPPVCASIAIDSAPSDPSMLSQHPKHRPHGTGLERQSEELRPRLVTHDDRKARARAQKSRRRAISARRPCHVVRTLDYRCRLRLAMAPTPTTATPANVRSAAIVAQLLPLAPSPPGPVPVSGAVTPVAAVAAGAGAGGAVGAGGACAESTSPQETYTLDSATDLWTLIMSPCRRVPTARHSGS